MYTRSVQEATADAQAFPRLELRCAPLLLGLTYRALAGAADPQAAPLTQRRLEHLQAAATELLAQVSALKTDVQVALDKARAAQQDAQKAQLDLQLLAEQQPPAPSKRGWRVAKPTPAEAEAERQRSQLEAHARLLAETAHKLNDTCNKSTQALAIREQELAAAQQQRAQLVQTLQEQLAAHALELTARGQHAEARTLLSDARRLVRGDLMTAVLLTLTALFTGGADAARAALMELKTIFGQHRDPLPRMLEALIRWLEGQPLGPAELGAFGAEQFSQPAFYRLYLLLHALAGQRASEQLPRSSPFAAALFAVEQHGASTGNAPWLGDAALLKWAQSQDAWHRLLALNALREPQNHAGQALAVAGIDVDQLRQPPKRRQAVPELLSLVRALPLPAWPPALSGRVYCALACHALWLLATLPDSPLLRQFIEQSYGWPKDHLYWWTLAAVQHDSSLTRNVTADPGGMELVRL